MNTWGGTYTSADSQKQEQFYEDQILRVRSLEARLLIAASLVILFGGWLAYQNKTEHFDEVEQQLEDGLLLNLNAVESKQDILPFLDIYSDPEERDRVAHRLSDYIIRTGASLPNVGRINTRIWEEDGKRKRVFSSAIEFRRLKPLCVVRTPDAFGRLFLIHLFLFLAGFYAVHVLWRYTPIPFRKSKFTGDPMLLPIVLLLTGIGFIMMVSMRDPLRDLVIFTDYAQGVLIGCAVMLIASFINIQRFRRYWGLWLLASLALFVMLGLFGVGPEGSDARVNLRVGGTLVQPGEAIKLLVVLFLAGVFARYGDYLRLHENRIRALRALPFRVPRLELFLPIALAVVLTLLLFYELKELGSALIISFCFLAFYGVVRGAPGLTILGMLLIIAGFWFGYEFTTTVANRIMMWLSPWDNLASVGGDHLASGQWALAQGGLSGMGLGRGSPAFVPEAHTDFILPAIGEELGFVGILTVFVLFGLLIHRVLQISLNADSLFKRLVGIGLILVMGMQIVLITGGTSGMLPLSGVVTPFLSYGKTSMILNLGVIGMFASISENTVLQEQDTNYRKPLKWVLGILVGILALILLRIGYIQVVKSNDILIRSALVKWGDGVRRPVYNPRINKLRDDLARGTIYDRNGLPLATSHWEVLEQHDSSYAALGVDIERVASRFDARHYPFGALTFHLLGDLRLTKVRHRENADAPFDTVWTRLNWFANNTSFVECEVQSHLRGYGEPCREARDDRELIPVVRNPRKEVPRFLSRDRDVRLSIDIRFQKRVAEILESNIRSSRKQRGAAVVLDAETGDLLASVTYPWSTALTPDSLTNPALMDRPRWAIYPPGSTFKLVTAIAALSKSQGTTLPTYQCSRLRDGRVGVEEISGWGSRPIRDDIGDAPHGTVGLRTGVTKSCNAYFAQLGTLYVGADDLYRTAKLFNITVASPDTPNELHQYLPQSAYGQGEVTATPFQMARVAATAATGGAIPYGRWIIDASNPRTQEPQKVLTSSQARQLARYMRRVVEAGTATRLRSNPIPIAGKTGTAEVANQVSHAWFVGFAPYGGTGRKIAFAVIIEHGRYGGHWAAQTAGEIVRAAADLGLMPRR